MLPTSEHAAARLGDALLDDHDFTANVADWLDTLDRYGALTAARALDRT